MNRQWILVLLPIALPGCAKPQFEFRGYSDLSSCTEIIDTELANGASFLGGYESDSIENPGYVTELNGTVFSESVRIEVLCNPSGYIDSIQYIAETTEPVETGAIWARFSEQLGMLFGEPAEIYSDDGRTRRYVCRRPSPIFLDEWRLEPDVDEEDPEEEHEIYLSVLPRATECLEGVAGR
jgi:hypothetical protein